MRVFSAGISPLQDACFPPAGIFETSESQKMFAGDLVPIKGLEIYKLSS